MIHHSNDGFLITMMPVQTTTPECNNGRISVYIGTITCVNMLVFYNEFNIYVK